MEPHPSNIPFIQILCLKINQTPHQDVSVALCALDVELIFLGDKPCLPYSANLHGHCNGIMDRNSEQTDKIQVNCTYKKLLF